MNDFGKLPKRVQDYLIAWKEEYYLDYERLCGEIPLEKLTMSELRVLFNLSIEIERKNLLSISILNK